jgi:hypothetical protein
MCAVALAVLPIRAGAQNGPGAPITRTIRGTVLDATTRKPVAAAQVRPSGSDAAVFTEADGTFVIEGVAAGPVRLDIDDPGYASRSLDVPPTEDAIDVSLAPSPDKPVVITDTTCHLSLPQPREIHRWEVLSGFRVGGGLDSRDHGGSVVDLGVRAEVTYAARSWRSPFRIGPFAALASTNFGSLEPMAGLTSYWGKQRILDTGRYQGSGAWVVSMSGGYALRRDSMGQDASVASVEAGYAFLLYRRLTTTGACRPGVTRDDVCEVGPRFPTSMRLYVNARMYTVDDPTWAVTLGVELEPVAFWSALATGFGM